MSYVRHMLPEPRLSDIKPRKLRFVELLGVWLLWLVAALVFLLGIAGLMLAYDMWDTDVANFLDWILAAAVTIGGLASIICALLLGPAATRWAQGAIRVREAQSLASAQHAMNDKHVKRLEEAVGDDPSTNNIRLLAGEYMARGWDGVDSAIRLLELSLDRHPHEAGLRILLAKALAMKGDLRSAIMHIDACGEKDPYDSEFVLACIQRIVRRYYDPTIGGLCERTRPFTVPVPKAQ
jgi:hypothetical protein